MGRYQEPACTVLRGDFAPHDTGVSLLHGHLTAEDNDCAFELTGDLTFVGTQRLTTQHGLEHMQRIGGNLRLESSSLTSLDGLAELRSIGGYLKMQSNSKLVHARGAPFLNEVGD